ncbi:hypothetical protein BV25DRAFT_1274406 [Artomyces pyxidatus]|uniref:Uncharacterized protein n=1 Tax=Artomyces pyxidatus TaxID=48021 RepID=A0ACB8TF48_9AGAM|nr:hypothetical protein BV25DRAFT_1274406 [Artomyces pyxidatus]
MHTRTLHKDHSRCYRLPWPPWIDIWPILRATGRMQSLVSRKVLQWSHFSDWLSERPPEHASSSVSSSYDVYDDGDARRREQKIFIADAERRLRAIDEATKRTGESTTRERIQSEFLAALQQRESDGRMAVSRLLLAHRDIEIQPDWTFKEAIAAFDKHDKLLHSQLDEALLGRCNEANAVRTLQKEVHDQAQTTREQGRVIYDLKKELHEQGRALDEQDRVLRSQGDTIRRQNNLILEQEQAIRQQSLTIHEFGFKLLWLQQDWRRRDF